MWAHTGFKRYTKNTGWIFGTRVLTLAISFVATIYVARGLGPANFGQLSYAMSFIALFGFLASLGIDSILYRDLVRQPERKNVLLGTAFVIRVLAGTFIAVVATVLGFLLVEDDVSSLLILILSGTFVLSSFQIILFEFQARADSKYPSIVAVSIALILNVLKVIVIALNEGVIYLALIILLESVLYVIAYLYIYQRRNQESVMRWRFDKQYAVSLLKDSAPLVALSGFSIVYARIDQVFIKHIIDARAVGIYDAAVRIAELWSFIPGILLAALFPAIVNAKSTSDTLYNKRLARLALLLFVISVIIAITVTILASLIMGVLYGPAFAEGIPVLQIYIWSFTGVSLGILITQYLVTENYRRILAYVAFLPMIVNVSLNLLWIPHYGIIGAAYATLISYSLIPFMLLLFKPTRDRLGSVLLSFRDRI